MYKKSFAVQTQNLLSKKDVKALKLQIVDQFPLLDEKAIDELLPEGQVKVLKLDTRCLLYAVGEAAPAFFDVEGRGDLFPTITTLWQHPYMMAELTIHAQVSKFVLNGADLMLPGVIVPANGIAGFGTVKKGEKRCIKIEGNPYAIAVGKMLVNQSGMEKLKGKGLEVCHVFKDALWAHSGKPIPNAGFAEKDDEITPCADASYVHGEGGAAAPAADAGDASPSVSLAAAADKPSSVSVPADASPAAAAAAAAPSEETAPAAAAAATGAGARAPDSWSQDDLLDFCFIQAFRTSDDKMLPVEASDLYEKHMKPRKPEGTTLDVKKSTHKQIGKYLNAMRKAKVVDVVEKKNVVSVTKVDRGHKAFKALEEKFAGDLAEALAAAAGGGSGAAAPAGAKGTSNLPPPPVVKTVWKTSHYLESLFKGMGKRKDDLFTWEQARAILAAYVQKEGLGDGLEGKVKLNEELNKAIIHVAGGQKKDAAVLEEIDGEELEEKMRERMSEHTSIEVAGIGAVIRKGPQAKIEVSLSRKGAHNVTRACNLEAYGLDPTAMGDELKKKLNCTVNIEDMPGKTSKDKLLQLQGHMEQELAEFLLQRYGITKGFMSIK